MATTEELRQIQLIFSPINQDSFYQDCYEFNFSPHVKKTWSTINSALVKVFLLLGTLVPSLKTINALLEKWLRNATQQLDQPPICKVTQLPLQHTNIVISYLFGNSEGNVPEEVMESGQNPARKVEKHQLG